VSQVRESGPFDKLRAGSGAPGGIRWGSVFRSLEIQRPSNRLVEVRAFPGLKIQTWGTRPGRIGGMKVSKRTANIMMIAGAGLGVLLMFGLQFEYPRIANHFGNPSWLANVLTGLIIVGGILAALRLFKKKNSN
jgi:hypothetical protein